MRIAPTDPRLNIRGAIRAHLVEGALRIDRPIADEGGLGADAPGAAVELFTDADLLTVHLRRNGRHLRQDAVNRTLVITNGEQLLARGEIPAGSLVEFIWAVKFPTAQTLRTLCFHFPYGESVDLIGFSLPDNACIGTASPKHGYRWLACGDSITHGFHASTPLHTYPAVLAAAKGWEALNAGVGGRCIEADDGAILAGIPADLVTILLGYNDYNHQRDPALSAANLTQMLRALRSGGTPFRPIFVITPLWSSIAGPGVKGHSLADYRRAIAIATESLADPATWTIDGEALIDHRPACFRDGIHPNDTGFAALAASLSSRLPEPGNLTACSERKFPGNQLPVPGLGELTANRST